MTFIATPWNHQTQKRWELKRYRVLQYDKKAIVVGCKSIMDSYICFDALRPSQQCFSNVMMITCLPGLNQFEAEDKVSYSRKQHSDWWVWN